MKQKKEKKSVLKSMMESWKKMDSERKTVIVIVAVVLLFMVCMPYLYKGWVNFRDNGFHFGSDKGGSTVKKEPKDPNAGKTLTMTCSQSLKDNDYTTSIKTVITYVDKQLKKEDYTLTMKAISDIGKEELPIRKELYTESEEIYKKYKGFSVKSNLNNDTFSFNVVTNYADVDRDAINAESETGVSSVFVDLEFNQSIDSVKSYYEGMGLTCRK